MALFTVKILKKNGHIEEFNKEYSDTDTLQHDMLEKGYIIVDFKERANRKRHIYQSYYYIKNFLSSKTLTETDVYNLFYELGIFLKSGIPIVRAFSMIHEESNSKVLLKFIENVIFLLKEGKDFSTILENSNEYFNFTPFIPIVKIGESTGSLDKSFFNISSNLGKWIKIKGEITSALMYPFLLTGTSFAAIYIMLAYVIPRFEDIVKSFKIALPLHTQILFKLSIFLNKNQDAVIISSILFLSILLLLSKKEKFRLFINDLINIIPIVKNIRFATENIRFLNSLSNLLNGGVPILISLELSIGNFSSSKIKRKMINVLTSIKKGGHLAGALNEADIFPEIIPNMIRVGEESGTLPEVLNELYNFMSEKFLKKIKKLMNLLEPLIIIFISIFIGVMIMSILPIIMNLSDANI